MPERGPAAVRRRETAESPLGGMSSPKRRARLKYRCFWRTTQAHERASDGRRIDAAPGDDPEYSRRGSAATGRRSCCSLLGLRVQPPGRPETGGPG